MDEISKYFYLLNIQIDISITPIMTESVPHAHRIEQFSENNSTPVRA